MECEDGTELMRKAAKGDAKAFSRLYYTSIPILRLFLAKRGGHCSEPDDFIQKVLIRLWQQRENFRGESSFLTYLLAIARYTLNEEVRQSRKTARIRMEAGPGYAGDSRNELSQPEVELYLQELHAALERAEAKLTAEQRQALEVSQAADVTLHEASKALGCSSKALECRLRRARNQLRRPLASVLKET